MLLIAACDKKEDKKDDKKGDKKGDEYTLRSCTRNTNDARIESVDGRDIELVITHGAGTLKMATGTRGLGTRSFPKTPLPATVAIRVQPGSNFNLEIEGVEGEALGCALEFTIRSKLGVEGPFALCQEAEDCRSDGMTVAVVQQGEL